MSTITKTNLKRFQQSLRRISLKQGFYDTFYDHFIAQSDEIAAIFHARDMDQLKGKLKETLQMVEDALMGKPGVVLYLEMLGRIHTRLKVDQRHFEMWKYALLSTIERYDDEYDAEVKMAWEAAIETVVSLMYPESSMVGMAASQ
ncbi:MAG: globin [Candidatus Thiodiazotropha lotti]|uniref:Globin domain-containing protein n=1 Tax=Candidatus Thiodiazotropha endoloripes TaxID=1818881 RepID=A0A1E2UUQ1_9GAMM|nr:globin domain-containing protein [Candidatus Thiodiazotropha endoloripes]MCG7899230.1 globin [Candidatus Thiodiazotropha weberae]MCG7986742.1 globin [Candidatus Thiodiazotropha lotti]MCG7902837.1 globin [Candidatus Thiodiazotropha weberae]MCG7912518.1 globin [Candidatus Thiodiazotropha weberae]MCG7991331.1 globin [Candidatus Thiodiazotropha lotti]